MSESSAQQPTADSDPNFVRVRRDIITEDNWPEYAAKGFVFLENQEDRADATHLSRIDSVENFFGSKNVYTGHAFDLDEERPLAHKPGLGIYAGPDADQELARCWPQEEETGDGRQSPPSQGGPASS
ncbi:MAG TPA: hypothetical protein VFH99_02690 [Candidatus Saccharimonadales bacterium]|nr:hypothetical protein [Candidatus Saccharimonadales bacterium]